MSILFKDYEVSIWNYVDHGETFEESKLAVIGSSDMTALSRCVQPNLTLRANGNNTFSFVLYTRYYDGMEKVDNPFIKLMYNGRRVKVRVEDEWYDFVVTDIQESSDNKSITYSCVDAFNYELGKSGYELEFDEELETLGTTTELAEMILAGTAWEIDEDKNEIIRQYKYEQLVEYQIPPDATDQMRYRYTPVLGGDPIDLGANDYLYGFYSQLEDTENQQFIIYENGSQLPSDAPVSLDRLEYPTYFGPHPTGTGTPIAIKANRLVDTYEGNVDRTIDKYYNTYIKDDHEYRVFSEVEYKKPYTLTNYIDVSGFMGYRYEVGIGESKQTYEASIVEEGYYPALTSETLLETNRQKYYSWFNEGNDGSVFYGINSLKNRIDFLSEGQKLILEIKYLQPVTEETHSKIEDIKVLNFKRNWNSETEKENDYYMENIDHKQSDDNLTHYFILESTKTITSEQLLQLANLKLEVIFRNEAEESVKITQARLYDYIEADNTLGFYIPEDLMNSTYIQNIQPITYYYVYDPEQDPAYTSLDDLVIIEKTTDLSEYTRKSLYYEKVRSITGKQSNRFNLLQTICERFECWLHFSFEREPNGKVISKKIYFTDTQGKQIYYGFISGINLKNSQRTLKSENLVTRLITSPNANEFAEGGSCNISLSQWNYTGENALYNFDYYISKGAIDRQTWLDDFYLTPATSEQHEGWFVQLHNKNANREELIISITELSSSLNKAKADVELAKAGMNSAFDEKQVYDNYIAARALASHDDICEFIRNYDPDDPGAQTDVYDFYMSLLDDNKFIYYWVKYEEANNSYDEYEHLLNTSQTIYDQLETQITYNYGELVNLNQEKQEIYDEIYAKYYPFIQEGSWINEDYFDNDLYYVDAETTLYTSAYPEVSYSLSVVDIEALEDFKAYKFIPGDISFVEDTEFFGWEDDNITPHRLKVWITEKKINLDDPSNTTITIQNYANDFDSLFQKITAATQTLQYKEGVYNRSGKIVNGDGQVEYQAIANTLKIAPISLENLGAQSVTVNEDGIIVTSLLQPSHKVRIIGDGIYISDNGGNEYFPVITGAGTNLSKLTAGQIDTTNINIVDGSFNMFRWDDTGINAYWYDDQAGVKTYDINKFVRLDRFGLYGYHHPLQESEVPTIFKPTTLEDLVGYRDGIHPDNTDIKFALTWKGLDFRSENGFIRFSSEDDRITISNGNSVMELGALTSGGFGFNIGSLENIPIVNSEINNINGNIGDINNSLGDHIERQRQWIRYDDEHGLVLGKENDPIKANLTNSELAFINGSVKNAYISSDELYISKAKIVGPDLDNENALLFIGEWQFIRRHDGSLDIKRGNN